MNEVIERMRGLPPSKWGLHETVVCQRLGLTSKEGISVRSQLMEVVKALKKGYTGNQREKTAVLTGYPPTDLESSFPNQLNVHLTFYGARENFAADSLAGVSHVSARPRYFWFGASENPRVSIKTQLEIVKAVTGTASNLDDTTKTRRATLWRAWYEKNARGGVKTFETADLPAIVSEFRGILATGATATVEREIREILLASNAIQGRTRQNQGVSPSEVKNQSQTSQSQNQNSKIFL